MGKKLFIGLAIVNAIVLILDIIAKNGNAIIFSVIALICCSLSAVISD